MKNCEICKVRFSRADNLKRHMINYHSKQSDNRPKCPLCETWFKSNTFLKKHLLKLHRSNDNPQPSTSSATLNSIDHNPQPSTSSASLNSTDKPPLKRKSEINNSSQPKKKRRTAVIHCDVCNLDIKKNVYNAHLRTNKHKQNSSVLYKSNNIHIIKSVFKKRIQSFKIVNLNKEELIFDEFFKVIKTAIITLIEEHIKLFTTVKVNIELFGLYELIKKDEIDTDIKSFNTRNEIMSVSSDLNNIIETWFEIIKVKSEDFNEQNSGWSLLEILHMEVNINKYEPMKASGNTIVPKNIAKKNAVVNVLCSDERCFAYAILSALFPTDSSVNYIYDYPNYQDHLDFTDIDLPMSFINIAKFENQNDISINVFGLNQSNTKVIGPLHHTKHRKDRHINLLYYEYRLKKHYVWIKDLSRLVGRQLSKNKTKKYLCDGCLLYFMKKSKLLDHQKDNCHKLKITLPSEGKTIK